MDSDAILKDSNDRWANHYVVRRTSLALTSRDIDMIPYFDVCTRKDEHRIVNHQHKMSNYRFYIGSARLDNLNLEPPTISGRNMTSLFTVEFWSERVEKSLISP